MPDRRETLALTDYALRKPFLVLVILGVVIVLGFGAYFRLGVDLFPKVRFPLVSITYPDPGASPREILRTLTIPLENALSTLPHIRHVHSVIVPGATVLTAVFDDEALGHSPQIAVREAIDRLLPSLPPGLPSPEITRENPTRLPMMWIIFPLPSAETRKASPGSLKTTGKEEGPAEISFVRNVLVPSLMKVRGVQSVKLLMPPPEQVHLYLHGDSLRKTGLSIPDLARQLREQAREYPSGFLSTGDRFVNLEARGRPLSLEGLPAFPVLLPSGRTVPLGSIAAITRGTERPAELFRFDGKEAIAAKVFSLEDANLVALSGRIHRVLERKISGKSGESAVPPGRFPAIVRMDRSVAVERNNRELLETLFLGAVLSVLVILAFLGNLRETAVAAIAIPTSVLAAFPLLLMAHFTLNNLTMLGLSLVVGILIDDAIVVLENINRHRMMGESPLAAARFGTGEIGRAVLATTFSIIAVFTPMAMMHGVLGEFFTQFGWTVSFAVMASLLVSLTVSPLLTTARFAGGEPFPHRHLFPSAVVLGNRVREVYGRLLARSMDHPVFLIGLCLVLLAGGLLLGGNLGWNLIPEEDQGAFLVHMSLTGSPSIEKADQVATELTKKLRSLPGVLSVFQEVGGRRGVPPSEGYLYVNLVSRSRRNDPDSVFMERTRKILSSVPGMVYSVDDLSPLGGTGENAPFECFLMGPDPVILNQLAGTMRDFLKTVEGLRDVRTSSSGSRDILLIRPSEKNSPEWRISSGRLSWWLSSLTAGLPAGRVGTGDGSRDLWVSLAPADVDSPGKIASLPFPVGPGKILPFRDVATISRMKAQERMNRDDRTPSITISANIAPPGSLGQAMKRLDLWTGSHLPAGYHVRYAGNSDVLKDARVQIAQAMMVAVLVVFALLSVQFESLVLPFVIMISIPFSLVGAILGLWISGIPVNIMGAIGLIILFGLVTKNAILLVDYANTLKRRGRSVREAAIESARVRVRPIAMTTFAMVFGMAPMAVGWGAGGAVRESMAVVVIGGLVSSMFFSLFLVPVVYERVARFGKLKFHGEDSIKLEEGGGAE